MGTQNFFFVLRSSKDEKKDIFPYFFNELKTYHLSYFYAGRVSYELRNRSRSLWSLCDSVVEHRSAESESLRFDSSLSHARDNTKNIFLYFTHHLSYFYLQN